MSEKESHFSVLSKLNVNEFVKQKNGMKYLPWAPALEILLQHYPKATWEIKRFDGVPYLKTETGCFAEVEVTIEGITRSELLPVMDYRNQTILKPNAFQINSTIKRCLVKCLGLHGLGLYIYLGEDLPPSEAEAIEASIIELRELLKANNKYNKEFEGHFRKMSYDQLQAKIMENKG